MDLKTAIRTIPDYPKPGIMFRDITTLMADGAAFAQATAEMAAPWRDKRIDLVVGIEARGFVFGSAAALALGVGFVPLRKPGKLPFETVSEDYQLEYGTDTLHIHVDAIRAGQRILLVDDLIATGGTALAGANLVRRVGGEIVGAGFLVDLPELGGAERLKAQKVQVEALLSFEGH